MRPFARNQRHCNLYIASFLKFFNINTKLNFTCTFYDIISYELDLSFCHANEQISFLCGSLHTTRDRCCSIEDHRFDSYLYTRKLSVRQEPCGRFRLNRYVLQKILTSLRNVLAPIFILSTVVHPSKTIFSRLLHEF
jgi:hypothetical protein